jgi:branched-chain amino acid transport system permease protein
MEVILQGLAVGSIFALTALCFSITFSMAGVFNFAQAQFVMLGTFLAYVAASRLHLSIVLVILFSAAGGAIIGALEEVVAISRLGQDDGVARFVTTLGVFVTMEAAAQAIWGANPLVVHTGHFLSSNATIGGAPIGWADLILIALVIALAVAMHFWKSRTRFGVASRAALEDRTGASLRGVNTRRLSLAAFAVAGGIAGAVGVLVAVQTYATFNLAESLTVYGFAALAIGGFESQIGAIIAGFAIGLIQSEASLHFGGTSSDPILFIILVLVLLFRPAGLFQRPTARTV